MAAGAPGLREFFEVAPNLVRTRSLGLPGEILHVNSNRRRTHADRHQPRAVPLVDQEHVALQGQHLIGPIISGHAPGVCASPTRGEYLQLPRNFAEQFSIALFIEKVNAAGRCYTV